MAEALPAHLPDALWTHRTDLAALIAALGPGQARYVGGAVRDTLLGHPVKDVDVATPLLPDEVMARLSAAGVRTVPTGLAHGTVTAVLPDGPVEITTLREDVATDGRHATVAFGRDWHADAARRDFTINALYADPASGELFDWFGGREDLAAGRVRFIGAARQRIAEDHLRILRYFRFAARFGPTKSDAGPDAGPDAKLDAEAEAACADLAATLKGLSRERIGGELMRLLALPDPASTVARMAHLGVLGVILPEADPAPLARLVAEEAHQHVAPDPLRRLAALLPTDAVQAEHVAARLRLSTAQRKRLACAAARDGTPVDPRALAYRIGAEEARDRLLLAGETVAPLADWDRPRFPLKGGEVVARGIGAGPDVARILQRVESRWVAEGFPDRARVDVLLSEELA